MTTVLETPPVVAAPPADELLAFSRRVDWRFLLGDPDLGRVAVVGAAEPELANALGALAREHVRDADQHGTFDNVVLCNPTRADLAAAAALLRPGGWLYAEFDRSVGARLLGRRRPARGAKTLRRLGLADVALHWHWPSFGRTAEILPLRHRAPIRHAFDRRDRRRSARLRTLRDRLLLVTGRLPSLARSVSVVARRPPETPEGSAIAGLVRAAVPAEALVRFGLGEELVATLITPRFRTSRHVVALLFAPAGEQPVLVAKVPRLVGDAEAIEHEAAILTVLEEPAPGEHGVRGIPQVVALGEAHNRPVLVQTALRGRPLGPGHLRTDPERHVAAVFDWLADVADVTSTLPVFPAWRSLVAEPLDSLSRALSPQLDEAALLARTLRLTRPIAYANLELGVQHGDLSHPNLFDLDGGGIGVVDWELADVQGLPLYDASLFLAYAAFARAGARGVEAEAAAFEAAFLRPDGWAAKELARFAHRTGVPPHLVTPLFVACWARHTARTLLRAGGKTREEAVAWLRESRYYVLWQQSVESAATLRWEHS